MPELDLEEIGEKLARHRECLVRYAGGEVCEAGEIAEQLFAQVHELYRRLAENPCARCWHAKDEHGEHPKVCYSCARGQIDPNHGFDELAAPGTT